MQTVGWAVVENESEPVLLVEERGSRVIQYPGGAKLFAECDDLPHFLSKLTAQGFVVIRSGTGRPDDL